MPTLDPWPDDDSDIDDPQPGDMDDDDHGLPDGDDDLLICPACRRSIHQDTEKCPHCGDWITPVDTSGRTRQWLWLVAAGLVIAAMLLSAVL